MKEDQTILLLNQNMKNLIQEKQQIKRLKLSKFLLTIDLEICLKLLEDTVLYIVIKEIKSIEKDIKQNKENTNYYSTKTTTNTTKPKYRWSVQEVKLENEQPKRRTYGFEKEKGTPKEKNNSHRIIKTKNMKNNTITITEF